MNKELNETGIFRLRSRPFIVLHSFHQKDQRLNAPVLPRRRLYKDYYKLLDNEKASAAILNMITSTVPTLK